MKKSLLPVTLLFLLSLFLFRCGDLDQNEKIVVPKFHTASDEGLWINQSNTHVPVITFDGKDEINVVVPIKPTKRPIHYIEAIVLMDGNKEIDSNKFSFSYDEPRAHFKLPDPIKGNYKVIVKCNLHDMWMAPVVLPERGKGKK
jgi:desulfoferrodoxin (superoxide reductase-like protein)